MFVTRLQNWEAGWENISLFILVYGVRYTCSIELYCQICPKSDYQMSLLFLVFKSLPH